MPKTYSMGNFDYKAPLTLSEALQLLEDSKTDVSIMAGGTDLIVQMKYGYKSPSLIVDVKKIPELNHLDWNEENGLHIGAAVPVSDLLEYEKITDRFNMLAHACSCIGSKQIKNRATVGGNICNAAPSADSVPALLCLGARAIFVSARGTRTSLLDEFFSAPGKTAKTDDELLVSIEVPNPTPRSAGCYLNHTTREEMDIAVAGVASYIVLNAKKNSFADVKIALGAVAPTPIRAHSAEALLKAKPVTQDLIAEAASKAALEARPISDLRASGEYRREMVRVLTFRTLKRCCDELEMQV